MITERQEEQAALHALGLLESADRMAFETEIAAAPELRAWVARLRETSATLALAAPQISPPAALRARVMDSAVSAPPVPEDVIEFPFARLIPWAIAACAMFAATWFGYRTMNLRAENNSLRTELNLAEIASQMSQGELKERTLIAETMINKLGNQLKRQDDLTRMKVTALASLLGNSPEAQAIAVWDPELQSGLLTVEKLPALAENQDYQLWVVDPTYENPVNGGVFKVGADGRVALAFKTDQPIKTIAAFAVSLERKGGVAKAEGPMVLLGK